MEIDFKKLMSSKPDEGLQEYLDNRSKFVPEAIEAAIAEMQKRGRTFSADELANIRQEVQQRKETVAEDKEAFLFSRNNWKQNVVKDENAPVYYSQRSIYVFSTLFSSLFGAVLLATNIRKTESKKGLWEVVAFGIIFTGIQIWVISIIKNASSPLPSSNTSFLPLLFGLTGALILNAFFWKKYIGKDTKYRAKPIWIPLIVVVILVLILVVGLFMRMGYRII